jgi:hypothetical protein
MKYTNDEVHNALLKSRKLGVCWWSVMDPNWNDNVWHLVRLIPHLEENYPLEDWDAYTIFYYLKITNQWN